MRYHENIKRRRKELGLTQSELANAAGYTSKSTISKIEKGDIDLSTSMLNTIAKALQTTPTALLYGDGRPESSTGKGLPPGAVKLEEKEIPILGSVACGEPIYDPADEKIKVPVSYHADFGLYAKGDSMIGANIDDGDLVFFQEQTMVENGQIAAVAIDNEVLLKRVYYDPGKRIILQSENGDGSHPPIVVEGPDLDKVNFNMEIFEAFTKGYLESARSFLLPVETENLPYAAALFPYMQCVRFLTDYLNGDTYYKIRYPEHNLVRTKAQFKLLQSVEEHSGQMQKYIDGIMRP